MVKLMDILQLLSNGAGLLSLGVALIVAFFAVKNGVMKAASDAQSSAIGAMRSEIETLREKVEDVKKDNHKLQQTIDTICEALKIRGLVISIQGEMVNIADKNGSTTAKINDKSF